jgi:hypothetical protein
MVVVAAEEMVDRHQMVDLVVVVNLGLIQAGITKVIQILVVELDLDMVLVVLLLVLQEVQVSSCFVMQFLHHNKYH